MLRLISAALAALLTLLCLADIWLWHRGYTTGDTLLYSWARNPTGFRFFQLWTGGGGVRLMLGEEFTPPQSGPQLLSWTPGLQRGAYSGPTYPFDKSAEGKGWSFLGFEFWRLDSSYPHLDRHFKSITFSHASLILALALYPLWYAWKIRRARLQRKRARLGLCVRCGYDIRATLGRCPECGAMVVSALQDSPAASRDHL
ncbi:MAG TPA: hypothetical protein VGQ99_02075 [Tepidisphaeraceae bacterium]|jgi:hypothetical protein|nr:hypothetical protein [Tepidisphaeraceae bacterium]